MDYPSIRDPEHPIINTQMFEPPREALTPAIELTKGPNIKSLPEFEPLPNDLELPLLLKVGDNVSTDEILPAGARVLPFRSNIQRISKFVFEQTDETYCQRALSVRESGGHAIVGGTNYGQGSSREHAALAPRYLGLRVVLAQSFARIHRQNLVNFGVLPLTFADPADYKALARGDCIRIENLPDQLGGGESIVVQALNTHCNVLTRHALSPRQCEMLLAGGLINWVRAHHLQNTDQS